MGLLFWTFLILVLCTFPQFSLCYGNGAPDKACGSLTPRHGSFIAKSSDCPYEIKLSSSEVKGGDKVRINLVAPHGTPPFKGFIAAPTSKKVGGDLPEGDYGHFELVDSAITQIVDCEDGAKNRITHRNKEAKKNIEFIWITPKKNGEYVILVSFVESFPNFWLKHQSSVIRITSSRAHSQSSHFSWLVGAIVAFNIFKLIMSGLLTPTTVFNNKKMSHKIGDNLDLRVTNSDSKALKF